MDDLNKTPDGRVSLAVVIPAYNRHALVLDALASIRSQTIPPACVVVVDDGSSDGTADAVEAWAAGNPMPCPLQVVRQANAGVSRARNRGFAEIGHATHVAFLDSDDLWPEDFVARAAAVFRGDPGLVAASADRFTRHVSQDGAHRDDPPFDCASFAKAPLAAMACGFFSGVPNTVFAAAAVRQAGGFPAGMSYAEDQLMFARVAMQGRWGHVPGRPVVVRHFINPGKGIAAHLSDGNHAGACVALARGILAEYGKLADSDLRRKDARRLAAWAFGVAARRCELRGHRRFAAGLYAKAWRLHWVRVKFLRRMLKAWKP